jgi:hypothetical protein
MRLGSILKYQSKPLPKEIIPEASPFASPGKALKVERKSESQRNSCSVISEAIQTESEICEEKKKIVNLAYLQRIFVKKKCETLYSRYDLSDKIQVCRDKISSISIVVTFIDYCYCTEVKGVAVKFSDDFDLLHFKEKRKNNSSVCKLELKKANRAKFRLKIEDVVGFFIGP